MPMVNVVPPADGSRNSVTVNGRTYTSTPGTSISVPDFDAEVLLANGWQESFTSSGGGTSGGAITIADGADVALGSMQDPAWDGVQSSPSLMAMTKAYVNTLLAAYGLAGVPSSQFATMQGGPGAFPVNVTANPLPVDNVGAPYATYSVSVPNVAIAAGMTDIMTISGSTTKKVELLKVKISAVSGALALADLILVKRTTANAGGTLGAAIVPALNDSNDIAASATLKVYTVSPTTLGTSVGNVDSLKLTLDATTAPSNGIPAEMSPAQGGKPWVLNLGNESYCLNWNGQATAATANLTFIFRER
jgi:hypothetical protein